MNKHKQIIVGSLLMMVLAFSPVVGFAHTDKGQVLAQSKGPKASLVGSPVPVISGITAPTVLRAGQMGTWTVNAFDRANGTLSYAVDWGDSAGLRKSLAAEPAFVQTSTFDHVYDNAGTYKITFTVTSSNGKKTTSTVTVRVLAPAAGIPVIMDAVATSTHANKATLVWKTDVKSSSQVWFSTSSPVDTSGEPNISRGHKTMEHKIKLNKLTPDTTYFVVVGSANKAGTSKSAELSFKTAPKNNNRAPVIKSITGSSTIAVGELETVTVVAFDPKNSPLTYSVDWGDTPVTLRTLLTNPEEIFEQTSTFDHVYDAAGVYTAVFKVKNAAGLETSGSLVITVTGAAPDTIAPVISGTPEDILAEASTSTGAIVTYPNPTALDDVDGEVAVTCAPASGAAFALGETTVLCSATDAAGNATSSDFLVTVSDTTSPVITLNGEALVNLILGDTYNELGAKASDIVDPDVPVLIGGDVVNTGVAATYLVTYDAEDDAGNDATQVVRTVVVNPAP